MRILLLYRDLHRSGGVPDDVGALCRGILRNGNHEITAVVAPGDSGVASGVTRTVELPGVRSIRQVRRAILKADVDVVVLLPLLHPWNAAMQVLLAGLDAPLCVMPLGHAVSPYILDQRFGSKARMPLNRAFKTAHLRVVDGPLLRRAATVRCLSGWEAAQALRMGARRTFVLPEGFPALDDEQREPPAGRRGDRPIVFGYLGRLAPAQKGLDLLVEAVRTTADVVGIQTFKVLLGGPPVAGSRRLLEEQVSAAGLTNVEFLGRVPEQDKRAFWAACDYFLHVSRFETIARAAREAVVAGLPVIASRESNLGDWAADEGFGYRVDLTSRSMADAMIAACHAEPSMRDAMGRRARAFAEKWSWDEVARVFLAEVGRATATT